MSFMEREITDKQAWFRVDGNCGTNYVPAWLANYPRMHRLCVGATVDSEDFPRLFALLESCVKDYTENTRIEAITLIEGYGARLSAPGYMDCTEWAIFDSETEAQEYLDENYPEEEEDSEDD